MSKQGARSLLSTRDHTERTATATPGMDLPCTYSSHMGPGLGGVWWAEPLPALSTARSQRGYCAAGLMAMQWADWAVHINPVATQAQGPGL